MSFGIGAFPFGIFASAFNFNDGRPGPRMYTDIYFYGFVHVFTMTENMLTETVNHTHKNVSLLLYQI